MNEFIIENINSLLLIVGGLMVGSALAPMLDRKFSDNEKSKIFSKKQTFIYNKYIRQIDFLLFGGLLILCALYNFFVPTA